MKNGVGTSVCRARGYTSWINYYNTHARRVTTCSVYGCTNTDLVGAHVLTRQTENQYCIIAMCRGCNNPNNTGWLTINANRQVVTVTEEVAASNKFCQRECSIL